MTGFTGSQLTSGAVVKVLDRLFSEIDRTDAVVLPRAREERRKRGVTTDSGIADMLSGAYMAVSCEMGMFLYITARAQASRTVVEFGTSFGVSTVFLAAAVRDNGGGRVIASELNPEKVRAARRNLDEAGLGDLVEVREGDAHSTLAQGVDTIDLLLLDGWKDAYLTVLRLLEPRLRSGSVVIADDLNIYPQVLKGYLDYVRSPDNGYHSVEVPIGDGIEISLRL